MSKFSYQKKEDKVPLKAHEHLVVKEHKEHDHPKPRQEPPEDKREGRADVTEPPLGGGTPEPPLAEDPVLPVGKVRVYGDASATYGSMVAPEVIRPYSEEIDEALEPVRKKKSKKE